MTLPGSASPGLAGHDTGEIPPTSRRPGVEYAQGGTLPPGDRELRLRNAKGRTEPEAERPGVKCASNQNRESAGEDRAGTAGMPVGAEHAVLSCRCGLVRVSRVAFWRLLPPGLITAYHAAEGCGLVTERTP